MKILITGGTGVIGTGTIPALLRAGHEVRLLSRHADRDARRFPAGVESVSADLGQSEDLRTAVQGCDAVLHIAGIVEESPPEITFEKVNVAGTQALVAAAAAAGAPYFVYLSSLGADRGQSAYHQSKLRAEEIVRAYAGPWLILRPGNVYGPGDETVSLLLKMIRNLPVVPMVDRGDQPFQPLWFDDAGAALALAVGRRDLAGRVLTIAGPDVTTTADVFDRLAAITDRNPPRLPIPAWLAQLGAGASESGEGLVAKLLRSAGFTAPLSPAKLQMLLEGSVVPAGTENALTTELAGPLTPLQEALEMLADLLPEQLPGEGVGAVERSTYFADLERTAYSPETLLTLVLNRIAEIMPIEFAAEPGAPTTPETGTTMTGAIPGRGHFQVRMLEREDSHATFVTVDGHPLAGVLTFATQTAEAGVRFSIELVAQSADAIDWLALRSGGHFFQSQNWRSVVRRVIELSGGTAPRGVEKRSEKLAAEEVEALNSRMREHVAARERRNTEHELGAEN